MDYFRGGVTGGGYDPSWITANEGVINLNIESGSTIRKAFLFIEVYGNPENRTMLINDFPVELSNELFFSEPFHFISGSGNSYFIRTSVADITTLIQSNVIQINPPQNQPNVNQGGRWVNFYVLILYENQLMEPTNIAVVLNETDCGGQVSYEVNDLNTIDTTKAVGFALNSSHICSTDLDGSLVYVNNEYIGTIGGMNPIESVYCGVSGAFYYQNNTLFGLNDDLPNPTVNGTDAIANIQGYMETNQNFTISFVYHDIINPVPIYAPYTNALLQFFYAYTTPCQPFETSLLTSDTTTCVNIPLQLNASGGIAYEWLPQTNLSCYDCPNPVFLGDSTINYTVRIWAGDSCSKVLPVRVRVFPRPDFESVDVTENICGFEVGAIVGASTGLSLPHSYQINNSTPQNDFNFSNLEAGIYTITVTDANGCSRDSTVQILEVNNVQAAFSVNPSSGAAPLTVQTQNNSQNATEYQWFWENQISTEFSPSITLDTAGIYTLTLVASNGAMHCNDTTSALIFVEEPFVVFAYTYVTDEADIYQIYLSGVSEYRYDLYALDGKLVYRQNGNVEAAGYVDLWEISGVASGMYVFRVKVKDANGSEDEIEGKVVVVR